MPAILEVKALQVPTHIVDVLAPSGDVSILEFLKDRCQQELPLDWVESQFEEWSHRLKFNCMELTSRVDALEGTPRTLSQQKTTPSDRYKPRGSATNSEDPKRFSKQSLELMREARRAGAIADAGDPDSESITDSESKADEYDEPRKEPPKRTTSKSAKSAVLTSAEPSTRIRKPPDVFEPGAKNPRAAKEIVNSRTGESQQKRQRAHHTPMAKESVASLDTNIAALAVARDLKAREQEVRDLKLSIKDLQQTLASDSQVQGLKDEITAYKSTLRSSITLAVALLKASGQDIQYTELMSTFYGASECCPNLVKAPSRR